MTCDGEASVEITDSTLDLESIFSVLDDVAGPEIKRQDDLILIVPSDLSGRYEGIAFPGGTREIFRYLRECAGDQATVEAAVRDEDYREFEFLSVDIILPVLFVANSILLPIAVNVLSDWISRRLRTSDKQNNDKTVKSEIHFQEHGKLKRIIYEGPASTFETVILESLRAQEAPSPSDENDDDTTVE